MNGGAGDDSLTGGLGNDTLDGGPGNNVLVGGLGVDTWAILGSSDPDIINVQSATKMGTRVTNSVTIQQDSFSDLVDAVDRLFLSGDSGDDIIAISGSPAAEIWGGDGNDNLQGGARNDSLYGGMGDDELDGEGGHDLVYGGGGNDGVAGGTGSNTLLVSGGVDALVTGQNAILLKGLTANSQVALSFTMPFTMEGTLHGFQSTMTGTADATATVDTNGIASGTFIANGSGTGTGTGEFAGATLAFSFTASGTLSGPLNAVVVTANYTGSGTVLTPDGSETGSLSGTWSSTISCPLGKATQNLKDSVGGALHGDANIPQFNTSVTDPLAIPVNSPPKTRLQILADELLRSGSGLTLTHEIKESLHRDSTNETPAAQLKQIRLGNKVKSTFDGRLVAVDVRVLEMMQKLGKDYGSQTVFITDIAGGTHGNISRHYRDNLGLAVDIGGSFDGSDLNTPGGRQAAVQKLWDNNFFQAQALSPSRSNDWYEIGVEKATEVTGLGIFFKGKGGKHLGSASGTGYAELWELSYSSGKTVRLKFHTDGRDHLHLGLQRLTVNLSEADIGVLFPEAPGGP